MITRDKKTKIIEELDRDIESAKAIFFLNFHGEDVAKTNRLRKALKSEKITYKVARKTLIKKALEKYNFKGTAVNYEGEIALMFSGEEDVVLAAKFILNQIKKNKFKILGGLWKNEYKDANFIMELSRLPSKEMIYGNLLMALNSPLKRLVGVLEGGIGNFIRVLDQIVKLKA